MGQEMNTTALANQTQSKINLIPTDADKDSKYRLGLLDRWMQAEKRTWHDLDLAAYRNHLLEAGSAQGQPLSPRTVAAHLSTIRARYEAILRQPATRNELYDLAGEELERLGQPGDPANRKALVDELTTRLANALDPKAAPVKVTVIQDHADDEHIRLTPEQASALILTPGVETMRGLRDTAVLALFLTTGIREQELSDLDEADLRCTFGGKLALRIREGKGKKQRMVVYGDDGETALAIVDKWLEMAGIESGAVFRGLYKGGSLRPGRVKVRMIQYIVGTYDVVISGELRTVRPHDLRRTYAKINYLNGMALLALAQQLGHSSTATTQGYIGTLNADERTPRRAFHFNGLLRRLSALEPGEAE